ncbi:NACHT domain-containing protein [Streptosporangium sp. NPDC051023]|uniref:NACHT domain-containing protein n=1 Tax=Streptosporangium sp. NPDC051023 TaxID=3155410 RepID=UPI00344D41B9
MRRGGARWAAIFLGIICLVPLVAAVTLGWRALPKAQIGTIDPLGTVVGLLALAVALAALWPAIRALRPQEDPAAELARKVRETEGKALAQLLGRGEAIALEFTFRPARTGGVAAPPTPDDLDKVVAHHRDFRPRQLVIEGEAGAGKTVLALRLMLGLLDGRRPEDPVPVRLSATSWAVPAWTVEEWLRRHLTDVYGLSSATARALIGSHMVLPVVDGLDEMDGGLGSGYSSQAGRALRALNEYQRDTQNRAGLVLTCRTKQYRDLRRALKRAAGREEDIAKIQISPIDVARAREFLHNRVDDPEQWTKVLDTIERAPLGPLAKVLSTPWGLTLAAFVYDRRDDGSDDGRYLNDPAALTDPGLETEDAVKEHLLDLFIPVATALRPPPGNASAARVRAWLTTLAAYCADNAATGRTVGFRKLSGTDIVPHELWPLAGSRLPRFLCSAIITVTWLLGAPLALTKLPIVPSPIPIFFNVVVSLPVVWASVVPWGFPWSKPLRMDLHRLRSRTGLRRLALGGVIGMVCWLGGWLAVGVVASFTIGFLPWLTSGFTVGQGVSAVVALGLGIVTALTVPGTMGVRDPREVLRASLAFGLVAGLGSGLGIGTALGGPGAVLLIGFLYGHVGAPLGLRYLAMLLCTRRWTGRWLPWRLGRFLHWCQEVGLVRVVGSAYQFRHRELQDYLARAPRPA